MAMLKMTGEVQTRHSAKYMTQLSNHLAHNVEVDLTSTTSVAKVPAGEIAMFAEPERLAITIQAESEEALEKFKEGIIRHIDRYGFREAPLHYQWTHDTA